MLIEPFAEPLAARSTAESGAGRVAIAKQLQTGSIKTKEGPLQSHWSRNAGGDCEATANELNYKQKGPLLSRRPHEA